MIVNDGNNHAKGAVTYMNNTKDEGTDDSVGGYKVIGIIMIVLPLLIAFFLAILDLSQSKSLAIDEGKKSLESNLKDPASVRYGLVWVGRMKTKDEDDGVLVACGFYSARNSFGERNLSQAFIGGRGGAVFTNETAGSMMGELWNRTCFKNHEN